MMRLDHCRTTAILWLLCEIAQSGYIAWRLVLVLVLVVKWRGDKRVLEREQWCQQPRQNSHQDKGLCTICDVNVWIVVTSGLDTISDEHRYHGGASLLRWLLHTQVSKCAYQPRHCL